MPSHAELEEEDLCELAYAVMAILAPIVSPTGLNFFAIRAEASMLGFDLEYNDLDFVHPWSLSEVDDNRLVEVGRFFSLHYVKQELMRPDDQVGQSAPVIQGPQLP